MKSTFIRFFHLAIAIFLLGSCQFDDTDDNEKEGGDVEYIKIDPSEATSGYLEDIAEDFFFLPLSTKPDFFVGSISKMFLTNELIIIVSKSQESIFFFSSDGRPKYKIHAIGLGPGEYTQMNDVIFDEKNKKLEILDTNTQKIFIYDLNGKFVEEQRINDFNKAGYKFSKHNDFYVFDRVNFSLDSNRIGIYDENLKFIYSFLEIPSAIRNIGIASVHSFEEFDESLYYLPTLDNKIYSVTKNKVTPVYEFLFTQEIEEAKKNISKLNARNINEYQNNIGSTGYIYDSDFLFINPKFITFKFVTGTSQYENNLFYSKSSGKVKQYTNYKSRQNENLSLLSRVFAKRGDYFVAKVHPTQYENLPIATASTLDENSNPVLLFFRLKEF